MTRATHMYIQGGVGMQGSLVDSEGFPRADIDIIYAVRTARNKIICKLYTHTHPFFPYIIHVYYCCVLCCVQGLRNDHKAVMKMIEDKLHVIHADARLRRGEGSGVTGERRGNTLPTTFARVSQISDGSPSVIAVSIVNDPSVCVCVCVCRV